MNRPKSAEDLIRRGAPGPSKQAVAHSAERVRSWYLNNAPRIDWAELDAPLGRLYLAAGSLGLIHIALHGEMDTFLAELDGRARLEYRGDRIHKPLQALKAYFDQQRLSFNLPVDLRTVTPFQHRVLEAIQAIPPGEVWSYSDVARRIGRPRSARAVGQALGANPIPIIVPCHRVVTADGGLGGYSGGLEVKEYLLQHEGAR